MARVQRRRQNYQEGNAGATQASQEKQDDGVSHGTPPRGNHEDADVKLEFHTHNVHDNNDNTDCAENNNSDIAVTTNGDDRPDVHGCKGGQAGDQPRTQEFQEKGMMEIHKVFLPKKTMRMRTPIPILMHTMPMTTMHTLILLKTITVTFPWPPMVGIDLNCIIMKAKQVINP
jgi:hypothetical protein